MKKYLAYVKPYARKHRKTLLIVFVLTLAKTIGVLCIPYLFAEAIDYVIANQMHQLTITIVLWVIVNFSTTFISFLIARINNSLQRDFTYSVKECVSEQIYAIPTKEFSDYNSGKMHSLLLADTTTVVNYVNTLTGTLHTILTLVGAIVVLFSIRFELALILLASYPLTVYINHRSGLILKKASQEGMQANDDFVSFVKANTENLADIKMQDGSIKARKKYLQHADINRILALKAHGISIKNSLFVKLVGLSNHTILTVVGLCLVAIQSMPMSAYIAFNSYSKIVSSSLDSIVHLKVSLQPLLVSLDRLIELRNRYMKSIQEENASCEVNHISNIVINDLSIKFGKREILEGMSQKLAHGIIGIRGKNGSGKTSFLRVLLRELTPANGRVEVDGIPLSEISCRSICKTISYVGAKCSLYPLSIRDNLLLFENSAHITEEQIWVALDTVELSNDIEKLPQKLDTIIDDINMLSSGQKQKLFLARAILRDTDVYLLDEAISNLDPVAKERIKRWLIAKRHEKIIVIVSHTLDDYMICDSIIDIE